MLHKSHITISYSVIYEDVEKEEEAEAGSRNGGSGPFSMEAVLFLWKRKWKREKSTAST